MIAQCPVHPNQPAPLSCARCGRPACEYCLTANDDSRDDVCVDCEAKAEGPKGGLAWERRDASILARFARTTRDVILRPWQSFSRLDEGAIPIALGYTATVYAITSLITLAILAPCLMLTALGWSTPLQSVPESALVPMIAAACSGPIVFAAGGVVQALFIGALFHGIAAILGGKGAISTDIRAVAYGLGIQILWAPLLPALMLPVIGLVVLVVVTLFQIVYGGRLLTILAREKHQLSGGRAILAGWLLPGLALGAMVVWLVFSIWIASGPAEPPPDVYYDFTNEGGY